eukprot:994379-Rhodomonas_salina.2
MWYSRAEPGAFVLLVAMCASADLNSPASVRNQPNIFAISADFFAVTAGYSCQASRANAFARFALCRVQPVAFAGSY